MITKDIKKNQVRIQLNKDFYSLDCVKETIKRFRKIAKGKISVNKSLQVTLYPKNKELLEGIGYEFSNYVLSLMKNKNVI